MHKKKLMTVLPFHKRLLKRKLASQFILVVLINMESVDTISNKSNTFKRANFVNIFIYLAL